MKRQPFLSALLSSHEPRRFFLPRLRPPLSPGWGEGRHKGRFRGSREGFLRVLVGLAGVALVLAGCSSTPAKVDHGPIAARSFSFVKPVAPPAPQWQPVHTMIQEAITTNLAKRGFAKTDGIGDVTVGYLLIVGNNASTAPVTDYFGDSEGLDGLLGKAHATYTKSKNPNYFEAGTLVIDVIDSKSFKRLQRGHTTRPVLRNPSADARMANIQAAVDGILRDLRLAR